MAKMIPLHQIIQVEKVFRDVRIGGIVEKSNFLQEGERHLFPIHDEVANLIDKDSKVKITFYTTKDDIEDTDDSMKFKSHGVKYEIWNEENQGWDRVYEKMGPRGDSEKS